MKIKEAVVILIILFMLSCNTVQNIPEENVEPIVPTVSCNDRDGDGFGGGCSKGEDCDDTNEKINPSIKEICGNGVDEDCKEGDEICPEEKLKDSDRDGLTDYREVEFGTNPFKKDTDDDGLNDYFELFSSRTDPFVYDSDGDKFSDGGELNSGTDPLNEKIKPKDEDYDEMDDEWEIKNLRSLSYTPNTDADYDGLTNLEEYNIGTHPYKKDTDKDKLSDGDEILKYMTDALKFDTDEDGYYDGYEVQEKTNPLDALSFPTYNLQRNLQRRATAESGYRRAALPY